MGARQSFGFSLATAAVSDVGRVRTNNEDSFGHRWLADGTLFVMVADGMGGHEAGEVASGLAVQVVEEVVERDLEGDPRERLYHALLEANHAILEEGDRSGTRGMGTTSIVALIRGDRAYVALVGDSRCYHIRRGQLLWRTLDHTRVQMLLDNGEISEDDARNHPEAGMLTRALGHERMADGRGLEPDVLAEPLQLEPTDTLVLCSDGLHDLVEDWEIGQIIGGRAPEEAARALVATACDRGGHDNVTVAVITAGERAAEYDPNYVPEYFHPGGHDPLGEREATYDEPMDGTSGSHHLGRAHGLARAPAAAAPPSEPAPTSRRGLILAAAGVLALLLLLVVSGTVVGAVVWMGWL